MRPGEVVECADEDCHSTTFTTFHDETDRILIICVECGLVYRVLRE